LLFGLAAFTVLIAAVGVSALTSSEPAPPVPGATQVSFWDYKAGDCLTGVVAANSDAPWPDLMWLVPCADSHTYEVFYADFSYWPTGQPYPGTQAVEDAGSTRCDARFAQYVGVPREDSQFTYTDVIPYTKDSWNYPSRQIVCVAFEPAAGHPDGGLTRGSIKGSHQ
jgi:hypothetical protein